MEMAVMNLNRHHLSPLNERYYLPPVINHTLSHMKGNQWLPTKAQRSVCSSAGVPLRDARVSTLHQLAFRQKVRTVKATKGRGTGGGGGAAQEVQCKSVMLRSMGRTGSEEDEQ